MKVAVGRALLGITALILQSTGNQMLTLVVAHTCIVHKLRAFLFYQMSDSTLSPRPWMGSTVKIKPSASLDGIV